MKCQEMIEGSGPILWNLSYLVLVMLSVLVMCGDFRIFVIQMAEVSTDRWQH